MGHDLGLGQGIKGITDIENPLDEAGAVIPITRRVCRVCVRQMGDLVFQLEAVFQVELIDVGALERERA